MTGGRDTDDEESSGDSQSARLLMVAVLALAVASTAVLVLSDSAQWLRLGVLAALWAALLGVFLASRFRKAMAERESQVADLQSVYELELEREVAARREYELEVEAEARKRVEEANREDLADLRSELRALRENLERLNGGEVLVERFALRAQSTRMRSLPPDNQPRIVASGSGSGSGSGEDSARMRRSIMAPAGQPNVVDAASTELIPRSDLPAPPVARREPQRRERPAGYRPEPSRPQTPRDGAPVDDGERQRREAPAPVQPTRVARPVARPAVRQPQPSAQHPGQQQRPQPQRVAQRPAQPSGPLPLPEVQTQAWPREGVPSRPAAQRPTQGQQRRPQRVEPTPRQQPPRPESTPTIQASIRDMRPVPEPSDAGLSARLAPQRPEPEPAQVEPVRPAEPPRVEPSRAESTGGHRRAVDPPPAASSRHRVDEAPKDWQSYREWRQESEESGHRAKVDPPAHTVWQEEDPEVTGAHAAGKSVTELLAAHGQEEAPRRHRRRAE